MAKLNSTVDRVTRILVRDMVKSHKSGLKATWRNRKVVSIAKWDELSNRLKLKKRLGYIPEDHVFVPWVYNPQSETEERERKEWFDDWIDYLTEKQKPLFGEILCRECILHHKSGKHNDSIRETVMLDADKSFKYPCNVENIFKCPFSQNRQRDELFFLKKILDLVDDSLYHAKSLSQNNKMTIMANFDRNFSQEYRSPLDMKPTGWGTLEPRLGTFAISDVIVDSIQDIYNVLTSDTLLGIIIDRYITDIRNNSLESNIELADKLETIKLDALSYFSRIRKKIKIEDIRDSLGRNLEEEKKAHLMPRDKFKPTEKELNNDIPRSGNCMMCQGFANIKCVNCNTWVCPRHCKEHAINVHGYKFEKKE